MTKISSRFFAIFICLFVSLCICFQPTIYAKNTDEVSGNSAHDITSTVKSETGDNGINITYTDKEGNEKTFTNEKISIDIAGITDREGGQQSFWTTVLSEYRGIIVIVSGLAALTFVLLFIVSFIKLGKSAGNPQERSNCITAIVITGIAAAGCGGVALFVGAFYNMFI